MPSPRPLPAEVVALIVRYLMREDLYTCMLVSRLWHAESEAWHYSRLYISSYRNYEKEIQLTKARSHLLRSVDWSSREENYLVLHVLDIIFDYRPDEHISDSSQHASLSSSSSSSSSTFSAAAAASISVTPSARTLVPSVILPVYPLGPNRPFLTHLSFNGLARNWQFFDSILYNLSTLTTLRLCFSSFSVDTKYYIVDIDKILKTFPRLKDLTIDGWKHKYAPTEAGLKDLDLIRAEKTDDVAAGLGARHHCLETFFFCGTLVCREGPDAFTFFRRLGDLRRIVVGSDISAEMDAATCRPWALGRALSEHCPKLESIKLDIRGFWLYDLPILPSNKIPHITALVTKTLSSNNGTVSEDEDNLRQQLQEQQIRELLEGRTAEPYFPHLNSLIIGTSDALSAQDLISLGVQAQFLTRLHICMRPFQRKIPLDNVYDKDAPTAALRAIHSSVPSINTLVENRRLQKRRFFTNRDLMLFLQHCSSLQDFSLTRRCISFEDLADTSTSVTTARTPVIQPWACEKTLERLDISFDIPSANPEDHRLIWKHLGRLRKLRSLTLSPRYTQYSSKLSNLVPSFSHGVEGLLVEGGMGETLKEIRYLPRWWEVEDRRGMVLWFANRCPKLVGFGLEYLGCTFNVPRATKLDFMEDKDVKQCSIYRVFEEEWGNNRYQV